MCKENITVEELLDECDRLKSRLNSAHYQIKRAIAQLTNPPDDYHNMLGDTVDSVRAQLQAYLKAWEDHD